MRIKFILLTMLLYTNYTHAAITWDAQTVYEPKYFRSHTDSMVLDQNGSPHVFYGGSHLYHAYKTNSQWTVETIDPSSRVGLRASSAIDSNGAFHVIYEDTFLHETKYINNVNGSWVAQVLPIPRNTNRNIHIGTVAVDSKNNVHFAYSESDSIQGTIDLNYAVYSNNVWTITTIDTPSTNTDFRVIVDNNDTVHIAYARPPAVLPGYELVHASNASGAWVLELIDSTSSAPGSFYMHHDLAVDANGIVHAAFTAEFGYLMYANNASGQWVAQQTTSLSSSGQHMALQADSTGKAYITYVERARVINGDNYNLHIVSNASGAWIDQILDINTLSNFLDTNLIVDSQGDLHITYMRFDHGLGFTSQALMYQNNTTGSWVKESIDVSEENTFGGAPANPYPQPLGILSSVTTDSNGNTHISHIKGKRVDYSHNDYYFKRGQLMYSTNSNGEWVTTSVTSVHDVDNDRSSIVVDNLGYVHVVFYDDISHAIKYVNNTSGVWVEEVLETLAYRWGQGLTSNVALQIDGNGFAHIVYHRNSRIKYASNTSGNWLIEIVKVVSDDHFTNDSSGYVVLTIDDNNKAHIVYDDNYFNLVYANNLNGNWVHSIFYSYDPWHPPAGIDIVIAKSGVIHMVYGSRVKRGAFLFADGVKYGTNSTGSWQEEYILYLHNDMSVNNGEITDVKITLLPNGKPFVVYTHDIPKPVPVPDEKIFKSAYQSGSIWRETVIDKIFHVPHLGNADARAFRFPSITVNQQGDVVLAYHDWLASSLKYAVSQQFNSSRMDILLSDQEFGAIEIQQQAQRALVIKNIGENDLNISNIQLVGTDSNNFTLDISGGQQPCVTTSFTLAPNAQCDITVIFEPVTQGSKQVALEVDSDDPDYPKMTRSFSGRGIPSSSSTAGGGGGGGSISWQLVLLGLLWIVLHTYRTRPHKFL